MVDKGEDAQRRASPKITVTISQPNYDFLTERLMPANPKLGKLSQAVDWCLKVVKEAVENG